MKITLIKLGGSLITDKQRAHTFRRRATQNIAAQIREIRARQSGRRMIIGHGSGSFGHFEARRYGTLQGVHSAADWLGFAKVGCAASALSQLVLAELTAADLPALRFPPGALMRARRRRIVEMDTHHISTALEKNLLPLVYGDVAFDAEQGGTIIATEAIFAELVRRLDVERIILLGEVEGVLDGGSRLIASITPARLPQIKALLGGSSGVDVTGGMLQKVAEMTALVAAHPHLQITIASGSRPNVLVELLCGGSRIGTQIHAD